MSIPMKAVVQVIDNVLRAGFKKCTKVVNKKEKVTATRRGKGTRDKLRPTLVLTFGRLNYAERQLLKKQKPPFLIQKAFSKR